MGKKRQEKDKDGKRKVERESQGYSLQNKTMTDLWTRVSWGILYLTACITKAKVTIRLMHMYSLRNAV